MYKKRILIFSHGELIGDGMMKMPFIRALPLAFPNAHITWMSGRHPTVFKTTLKEMVNPYLHTVLSHTHFGNNKKDIFWTWEKLPLTLPYDYIINTEKKIIPTLALRSIPHKIFISSAFKWFLSDKKPLIIKKKILLLDRLLDLLSVAANHSIKGVFSDLIPKKWEEKAAFLLEPYLKTRKIVLLAPGAGGKFKCWPLENFIHLAKKLYADNILPAFILGPEETHWKAIIQGLFKEAFFPLQETQKSSVFLTIALGKLATVNVVNDAGVGHILSASDTPTISMWGPTDPLKSKPNGKIVHIVKAQDFGGSSMSLIPLEHVYQTIHDFLHKSTAS